jgi:hypothetical protein
MCAVANRGSDEFQDENGLFLNETTVALPPAPVADTQKMEAQWMQEWMQEWQLHYHRVMLAIKAGAGVTAGR